MTTAPNEFTVASMCRGKETFSTPQIAREVVRKRHRRGIKVDSYRCKVCDQWHLGNRTINNTARARKSAKAGPAKRRCLSEIEAWDGDISFGGSER